MLSKCVPEVLKVKGIEQTRKCIYIYIYMFLNPQMNAIHVVKRAICRETVQRIQMARESATIVEK